MKRNEDGSVGIPIDLADILPPAEPIVEPGATGDITPQDTPAEPVDKSKGKKPVLIPDTPQDPPADPPATPDGDGDGDDEPTMIASLIERWGIELEEGEVIEDTQEGLEILADRRAEALADERLSEFLEQHPEAAEYFDFLALGGKKEDFFKATTPELDYKTLDLTKTEVQKSVMRKWYKKNEYTTEEAEEAINDLETSGILDKQSKLAANKLDAMQSKEKEALIQETQRKAQAQQDRIRTYWTTIDQKIKTGTVKDFTIPEKDRKALYEYMSKPVQQGKSQEMIYNEQMTEEDRIIFAFLKMKKLDLNSLIKRAAATTNAKTLTQQLKAAESKMKSGDSRTGNTEFVLPDIDLKHIKPQ